MNGRLPRERVWNECIDTEARCDRRRGRTSSLLRRLPEPVTWITAPGNLSLLPTSGFDLRCLSWDDRHQALDRAYDLVISLEDEIEVANFAKESSAFPAVRRLHGRWPDRALYR